MTVGLFPFLGASALPGRALLGSICLLLVSHQGGACVGAVVLSIRFLVPIFDILLPQPLLWRQQMKSKSQWIFTCFFFFFSLTLPFSRETLHRKTFSGEKRVEQTSERELFKKEYNKEENHRINFYLCSFWNVSNSWCLSGCGWPDVSISKWHFDWLTDCLQHLLEKCMFHSWSSSHV